MTSRLRRAPAALVLILLLATPTGASELHEAYVAAMNAREAGDFAGYRTHLEEALRVDPSHPILHQHMSRAAAQLGDRDAAFRWAHSAIELGAAFELETDPFLSPLQEDGRWQGLLASYRQARMFTGDDDVRLDLGRGDLLPECFAFDPRDESFYFGSVADRSITRIDDEGNWSSFVSTEEFDLPSVLGVRIDLERNLLWALGNADSSLFASSQGLRTGVWAFDLASGEMAQRRLAADDGQRHNFNDLVLDETGAVYLTDAYAGTVLTLADETSQLEVLPGATGLAGPNGITYDPATRRLFVAEYPRGIRVFDLQSGENWPLATGPEWTLIGIDGLYFSHGHLITIQNAMGMSRVASVEIDGTSRRVVRATTLQANHPLADDPTTGVLVADELWYIVNSHIATYAATPENLPSFEPTRILRVHLD